MHNSGTQMRQRVRMLPPPRYLGEDGRDSWSASTCSDRIFSVRHASSSTAICICATLSHTSCSSDRISMPTSWTSLSKRPDMWLMHMSTSSGVTDGGNSDSSELYELRSVEPRLLADAEDINDSLRARVVSPLFPA